MVMMAAVVVMLVAVMVESMMASCSCGGDSDSRGADGGDFIGGDNGGCGIGHGYGGLWRWWCWWY